MITHNIVGAGSSKKNSSSATESSNTLRSKSYAALIDMLGAGPWEEFKNGINLGRVFCDKVPVQNQDGSQNFSNFNVDYRQGNISQTYMPIAPTTESITTVNTKLYYNVPIERAVSGSDIDILRVSVLTPTLQKIDKDTGSTYGTSVQYKIDYNSADNSTFRGITTSTGELIQNELDPATQHGGYSKYLIYYTITLQRVNGVAQPSVLTQYSKKNSENWGVSNVQTVYEDQVNWWYESDVSATDMWQYKVEATKGATVTINKLVGQDTVYSGVFTLTGKCTSNYERQISFRPTGTAPYIVRVTRLTADSVTQYLTNDLYFYTLSAAQEEKYTYPGCVLVGWQIDASQFSTIPTRSYLCKMLQVKIPDNYDPIARTYTGVWTGGFKTAWTDNPAWCYFDLLTNPYHGLGNRISEDMVDKFALYSIAQYCDELVSNGHGGLEPRFTCNLILTSRQEAYKVLQDFTTIFNGITYWGLGTIVPIQDCPKDPVYSFTNANVVDGTFNYQGSRYDTRYNAAVVTYNDKNNHYEQATTYVDDASDIADMGYVNSTNVSAFGCTSEGQARRYGRWILYTNSHDTDTISFQTGREGGIPRPGDIIQVMDSLRSKQKRGGRVLEATTSSIVFDRTFTFTSGITYTVSTISMSGKSQDAYFSFNGETNYVELSSAFKEDVAENSIFIISDSDVPVVLYRTIAISEKGGDIYEITGVLHNPGKWDYIEQDDPLKPATRVISVTDPVENITFSEVVYTDGLVTKAKVVISWAQQKYAQNYLISIEHPNGTSLSLESSTNSVEVHDTIPGELKVKVYAVNALGIQSAPASDSFTCTHDPITANIGTYTEATATSKTASNTVATTMTATDVFGLALSLTPEQMADVGSIASVGFYVSGSYGDVSVPLKAKIIYNDNGLTKEIILPDPLNNSGSYVVSGNITIPTTTGNASFMLSKSSAPYAFTIVSGSYFTVTNQR